MAAAITGNYVFVRPGQKAFKIASNYTNYVKLGIKGVTPYYLEGKVESDEFVINALLLDRNGKAVCEIVNNFPQGQGCRRRITPQGYVVEDEQGNPLLEIKVVENLCLLKGTLYGPDGEIVARDSNDDFLVYHGPLVLGKSGGSLGLVVR